MLMSRNKILLGLVSFAFLIFSTGARAGGGFTVQHVDTKEPRKWRSTTSITDHSTGKTVTHHHPRPGGGGKGRTEVTGGGHSEYHPHSVAIPAGDYKTKADLDAASQ